MPLYPALVRWVNSLHALPESNGNWKKAYRICEMKQYCIEQDFGVDSAVHMMGYG